MGLNPIWGSDFFCVLLWSILYISLYLFFVVFILRQLRYVGQSEMGDKSRSTLLRSCVEVSTSDNLTTFLKELGFKLVLDR